ncbi:hypothetical protein Fmac_010746 [Flemingia macrophylla]|uniref:NAC domain-containing protein n=1 Tax=Flemingia macrophylla TaxID=520843 RepID=A0ABD1MKG2_9FABA
MESRVYRKLVGLGFRPTDEELVNYYLKHKLLNDDPCVNVIPEIDLCQVEPWEVPVMLKDSEIRFDDPEWFFFSCLNFKYSNSKMVDRKTKHGFWKATGKDHEVRTSDTNTVIGTKKILVFNKGRVPRAVKSNWVMHEYHLANHQFQQAQRTLVICRLKKNPEKTTEGGTDSLVCNEGYPNSSMVSDYENHQEMAEGIPHGGTFAGMETISQAMPQAEKYCSPTQQSPIGFEQDLPSFSNYPFSNVYFENENNIMQTSFETTQISFETVQTPFETSQTPFETIQTPFETTQTPFETIEANEFFNSNFLYENSVFDEESMNVIVNSSTQLESLKRVYCESSDIDAEVFSKLVKIVMCIVDEYQASKRFKSSHDVVYGDMCLQSSNYETNQENEKRANNLTSEKADEIQKEVSKVEKKLRCYGAKCCFGIIGHISHIEHEKCHIGDGNLWTLWRYLFGCTKGCRLDVDELDGRGDYVNIVLGENEVSWSTRASYVILTKSRVDHDGWKFFQE